jgi:hypothetical protein
LTELSHAIGADPRRYFSPRITMRPLVPFRYGVSAIRTALYILRRRPSGVIVQNPPVPAALVGYLAARAVGARFVLDSHPLAFIRSGWRRVVPDRINRWLVRRAEAVMVTVPALAERVDAWGGKPLIVHEAPAQIEATPPPPLGERPRVLVVSSFAVDDPIWAVMEAARLTPEVDWVVTGAQERRPAGLADVAPPNVSFPGFVPLGQYRTLLAETNIVVSLTTREVAVTRAAYDAVWALRPLVLSGGSHMPELFPYAVAVQNDGDAIAAGVRDAIARYDALVQDAELAIELQRARWEEQAAALRDALAGRLG